MTQDRAGDRRIITTGRKEITTTVVESPKPIAAPLDATRTVASAQAIPGITFDAGGGGGYRDSIEVRGYSASNDMAVDGVCHGARYSRADAFTPPRIAVRNGAGGMFDGAGSPGADEYHRAAAGGNVRVGKDVAVRLDGADHGNRVPGRDVERFACRGVASSLATGMGRPAGPAPAYVRQEDRNTPVSGVPCHRNARYGGELPGGDRSESLRHRQSRPAGHDGGPADGHPADDQLAARNLMRWPHMPQDAGASVPQGGHCLAAANPTPTGAACTAGPANVVDAAGMFRAPNVTPLRPTAWPGLCQPSGACGLDSRTEKPASRKVAGRAPVALRVRIVNPDIHSIGPVNRTLTARSPSRSETRNVATGRFDTLEPARFLQVNDGVLRAYRHPRFRAPPRAFVPPGTIAPAATRGSRERLFSYRPGGVFHPVRDVGVHASCGNAKTPLSATLHLGCGTPATIGGPSATTDPSRAAPETARHYAAGVGVGRCRAAGARQPVLQLPTEVTSPS